MTGPLLVVDDNSAFLKLALRFLGQHSGAGDVRDASDAREALAIAEALRPRVVVVDLVMPGISGLELISQLRALLPEARIVAFTSYVEDGYRRAAEAAGAHAFVAKEQLALELIPALRDEGSPGPA